MDDTDRNIPRRTSRPYESSSSEWEEEDSFDSIILHAPPTDFLVRERPQYHFHRLAQHVNLPNYTLGQVVRDPIDMAVESSTQAATLVVASLLHDFDAAFIKRSCGSWTYAILAEKILEEDEDNNISEKSKLRFVVNSQGSTKNLSFHKWGECVRLVREPVEVNALLSRR